LFENDDFFVCTKKTLDYWMDIIRYTVAQSKQDVLAMYLNKVVFSSYWSSEDYKNKTRIKSFSRVCFIIFSGEPETFMTKDKIKGLLDKIKEVIKDVNAHPSLISLVGSPHRDPLLHPSADPAAESRDPERSVQDHLADTHHSHHADLQQARQRQVFAENGVGSTQAD